jgi:hypothetical protein
VADARQGTGTTRHHLSLEDLAAIAAAPPTATPAELARLLGLPREPVGWHFRRFRRAGGWYCELKLPPCTECGEPVIGPPKRITHPSCIPARKARWVREKRRCVIATAPPDVLEARRERERALASRYFGGLPADRRAALFARWHATGQRDYEITLAVADQRGAPWDEDDDRYILANMKQPGRELALALGRTLWAVYRRRRKLRGRFPTPACS